MYAFPMHRPDTDPFQITFTFTTGVYSCKVHPSPLPECGVRSIFAFLNSIRILFLEIHSSCPVKTLFPADSLHSSVLIRLISFISTMKLSLISTSSRNLLPWSIPYDRLVRLIFVRVAPGRMLPNIFVACVISRATITVVCSPCAKSTVQSCQTVLLLFDFPIVQDVARSPRRATATLSLVAFFHSLCLRLIILFPSHNISSWMQRTQAICKLFVRVSNPPLLAGIAPMLLTLDCDLGQALLLTVTIRKFLLSFEICAFYQSPSDRTAW